MSRSSAREVAEREARYRHVRDLLIQGHQPEEVARMAKTRVAIVKRVGEKAWDWHFESCVDCRREIGFRNHVDHPRRLHRCVPCAASLWNRTKMREYLIAVGAYR